MIQNRDEQIHKPKYLCNFLGLMVMQTNCLVACFSVTQSISHAPVQYFLYRISQLYHWVNRLFEDMGHFPDISRTENCKFKYHKFPTSMETLQY